MNNLIGRRSFLILCFLFFGVVFSGVGWYEYSLYTTPLPVDSMSSDAAFLIRQLGTRSQKKNFFGVVAELDSIEGIKDDPYVSPLKAQINSELSVVFEKVVSGSSSRKLALAQVNDVLNEKGWVNKIPDVKRIAPDFFLSAHWDWIIPGKKFQISLRLIRCSTTADFVEVTQIFNYPPYLEALKSQVQKNKIILFASTAMSVLCFLVCGLFLKGSF